MNLHEEELQKKVEANPSTDSGDLDTKSYQEVFRILKKEPPIKLSKNFEYRVSQMVTRKPEAESSRDVLWLSLGIFLIFIAFIIVVVFTGFSIDFGFLKAMSPYKGLVIFGIAFIGFLNWLDKKLLRGKSQHI